MSTAEAAPNQPEDDRGAGAWGEGLAYPEWIAGLLPVVDASRPEVGQGVVGA
jgi:hypothetical protein